MGREARKAVGNPWYEARKRAAEYDDRLSSRKGQPKVSNVGIRSGRCGVGPDEVYARG